MRKMLFPAILLASACSSPGGPYPSLQPRPAEAIDPRVPVPVPPADMRVSPGLTQQLDGLVSQAASGDVAFQPLASRAAELAKSAGPKESESWVVAQQALSAAIAARAPVARAVADADALGADRIHAKGGISAGDMMAIDTAAAKIAGIDSREAKLIDDIQAMLAR